MTGLPGAFAPNPYRDAVNGSLWTLPIELRLYIGVGLAGVAGLLGRRYLWAGVTLALVALVAAKPEWLPVVPDDGATRSLALLFGLGSVACAFRAAIPVTLAGLAGAVARVAVNPWGLGRGVLFPVLLAYIVRVVAYHPRLRWRAFNRLGDYSHGLHVFSFPIQQILIPVWYYRLALPMLALGSITAAVS